MSRRLPSLKALRAFEAVARQLSFARAADELHVTPAAVSQLVKQLEDYLGVPLLRRGRHLALNDPAAQALPLLTGAFDQLERAVGRMRTADAPGQLVLSTPPAFAARWLVPRLDDFQRRHPDIELRLLATRRLVDFSLEDVDAAIRFGRSADPDLHADRLMSETILPVAAPAVAANIASAADLAGCTLLNDEWHTGNEIFPDWETWLLSQGVTLGAPLRIRRFEDANLTIQAAVAGLGAALAWQSLVQADLENGRLVHLLGQIIPSDQAYHLVMPPEQLGSPKVAAFREWLLGQAA